MSKRNYKLQDIHDYLKEYYNLDWKHCQVRDWEVNHNNYERSIMQRDFVGKEETKLDVIAIVYYDKKRKSVRLRVTNDELEIYEINPYLHHYKQPELHWQDFLAQRYGQEQNQDMAL